MTVSQSRRLPGQFDVAQMGIGQEDIAKSRLMAASAIARIDHKTAVALGFSEGAKAMERRLAGADSGAFLIARDVASEPGFGVKRDSSVALRRDFGPVALTVSMESGSAWNNNILANDRSPYRMGSVSLDRRFGRAWLSAGVSKLDEKETLLGGRLGPAFGGSARSSTIFVDAEGRLNIGSGVTASVIGRRGWTSFSGGAFQTGAYSFDLVKAGVFGSQDQIGFRLAQPLRIDRGGLSLMLPTEYDYGNGQAVMTREQFSLSPSGREIDAEVSYATGLFGGWLSGNMYLRRQPGHVASADSDVGAAVRYRLKF